MTNESDLESLQADEQMRAATQKLRDKPWFPPPEAPAAEEPPDEAPPDEASPSSEPSS